ncbi:hypothetical protein WDW37_07170 [Bdellovibrionota bacterium FG-1]
MSRIRGLAGIKSLLSGCAIILFTATTAWANEKGASDPATFLSRWWGGHEIERQGPNGKYSGQLFQRFVWIDNQPAFNIGSIISFRFPKAGLPKGADGKPVFDRKEIAETIRQAMGFKAWNQRKQKDASVYEAEWAAVNRSMRVYIWETSETYAYSIATYRPAFAETFALESEWIQRHLANAMDKPRPWMEKWLRNPETRVVSSAENSSPSSLWTSFLFSSWASFEFFQSANAGPCASCTVGVDPPGCWAAAASCHEGAFMGQLGALGSAGGDMATAINGVNGHASQGVDDWQQTNAEVTKSNANWAATNRQLVDANKNAQDFNFQFKRTNDLMEKFMDPANAFAFAASAAAGATLGALAVNMAVQGLSEAGGAIYEAITHEKDKAKRLEAFQKAREIFEKSNLAAKELEKTIDNMMEWRKIGKGFSLSREEVISKLGTETELLRGDIVINTERRNQALRAGDRACAEELSGTINQINRKIREYEDIGKALDGVFGDQAFCEGLLDKLRAIRKTEGALEDARKIIIGAETSFMEDRHNEFVKGSKDIHDTAKASHFASYQKARENRINFAEENRDHELEAIQKIVDREINNCVVDIDEGKICDRFDRDAAIDMGERRRQMTLEQKNPNTSLDRRLYLESYSDYLVRWEKWQSSQREQCQQKNGATIGGQIPVFAALVRGRKSYRNWCENYLNGRRPFIDLGKRKVDVRNAYDEAVLSAEKEYASAARVKDALAPHNLTHEKALNAWAEWFRTVRNEQACLVSEAACDADSEVDEASLVSRYKSLAKKASQIEKVCQQFKVTPGYRTN